MANNIVKNCLRKPMDQGSRRYNYYPDGKGGLYGWIESKSQSVFVVPVDDNGYTYIINQERYTRKKFSWEGVAGRTDGEPYDVAAKRELLEETGISKQDYRSDRD